MQGIAQIRVICSIAVFGISRSSSEIEYLGIVPKIDWRGKVGEIGPISKLAAVVNRR